MFSFVLHSMEENTVAIISNSDWFFSMFFYLTTFLSST